MARKGSGKTGQKDYLDAIRVRCVKSLADSSDRSNGGATRTPSRVESVRGWRLHFSAPNVQDEVNSSCIGCQVNLFWKAYVR